MHLIEPALDFAKRTGLPGGRFPVRALQGRDREPLQRLRMSVKIRKRWQGWDGPEFLCDLR